MKIIAFLNFVCLVTLCTAIHIQIFTKEMLDSFKHFPDYTHHFVFFHRPTLDAMENHLETWDNQHGTSPLIQI